MEYSFDKNSENVECLMEQPSTGALKYLMNWPSVDIEFHDLMYSVPDINGKFA